MKVFVATDRQWSAAFAARIAEATDGGQERRRRIEERVFRAFMSAPEARRLRAPTGLYCFTLDQWRQAFAQWREAECRRQPQSVAAIEQHCGALEALMQSDWPIQAKLLVRECLAPEDHMPPEASAA